MSMQLIKFFTDDLWRYRVDAMPPSKRIAVNFLRVVVTAARRFHSDRCALMASALTFYSLLSIVPVLAAAFGIAKGFGFQDRLEAELLVSFADQREILERAIGFAQRMLEQTKGGVIAGVGVAFLLWSVTRLLSYIEGSFNYIWRAARPRSWGRTFSDYLAMIVVAPVVFIASSSMTVFIASQLEAFTDQTGIEQLAPATTFLVRSIPYVLIWFLFTFTYAFVPNTSVGLGTSLLAGIAAGSAFQIWQYSYIQFQIGVASYGAIYGSFAALPLFLIWLQVSWLIVLGGAQLAASMKNVRDYEFRTDVGELSPQFRTLLCLLIAQRHVQNFKRGEPALTNLEVSRELELPIRATSELTAELVKAHVLRPVQAEDPADTAFAPYRDIHQLTIYDVLEALGSTGNDVVPVKESGVRREIEAALADFAMRVGSSEKNRQIADLEKD